ncbi:RIP metalloprotease RseP [Granulicella tundricola]|uniref:Zinc metalloprotease n=1 Tax=Granulicella tundricola (strain ATCC BAA-1859 / DSM 23138 / MP5ACTX9) TaxID=1198114 RepID=E8X3G7_GRATM|nr:RIP metalloprotease RseP [Granulicella tundricola]ADW68158.1 membrane-associated zinc metalloprotease [Granulicella tundricola MP5ACTX9]
MLSGSSLAALPELAIVLGIMVLVHEFGHFAAAKLCGVRVEAFAIGFGKRLFGFIHDGTDYRINLLPLGGYVKMAGEMGPTGEDQVLTNDPGELQNHPRWQRTIIALAGPVANFILAFFLMMGVYMAHNEVMEYFSHTATIDYVSPNSAAARTGIQAGDKIVHFDTLENPTWEDVEVRAQLNLNQPTPFSYLHDGHRVDTKILVENKGRPDEFDFEKLGLVPVKQQTPPAVLSVSDKPNMPAARAGLQPNDRIESIDAFRPHSLAALIAYLQDANGKPAHLIIGRGTQTFPVDVTPEQGDNPDGTKAWQIGFRAQPSPTIIEHFSVAKAAAASWEFNKKNSLLIKDVLHRLFTRQVSVKSLSSPIGIGVQVHEAFDLPGWVPIIGTMALISLNLGIFNLLPIPILDGGMIAFLAIESLIRRDINQQLKERVYQVAFVCIVLFAAVVIFNDITKFIPTHIKS